MLNMNKSISLLRDKEVKLLKKEIKHWTKVLNNGKKDWDSRYSVLCKAYAEDWCEDCPIHDVDSRYTNCSGTPLELYQQHQIEYHNNHIYDKYTKVRCDGCKIHVVGIIKFLQGILNNI